MNFRPKPLPMTVKVFPYREGISTGNILWLGRFPMLAGKFPKDHPVGGGPTDTSEYGDGENIKAFRALGYWASCFPEGDGITWEPKLNQTDEQALRDITESFGWEVAHETQTATDRHERKPMTEENKKIVERCKARIPDEILRSAGNEDGFNACLLLAWQIGGMDALDEAAKRHDARLEKAR